MNERKTYLVIGVASGIGAVTSRVLRAKGAKVIGVDRTETDNADQFFQVDLSNPASIDNFVASLPEGLDGLANIADLPPTAPAQNVLRVNILGLRRLTLGLVDKLADGASLLNLAFLAGFGWAEALDQVKATLAFDFDSDIAGFAAEQGLDNGAQSYFLAK